MSEREITDLIEKKDYSLAKELLIKELEDSPQDIEMHKLLGLCNINLNNYDEALNSFNFVTKVNPEDAVSAYYCATVYIEKNDLKKAEDLLHKVIELRPDYLDAYKSLAVIYLKTNRANKVSEIGEKILKQNDKDAQIYDILAAAAMENTGFELAVKYLKKAVELESNNPKYITKLGLAYFAAGQVTTAIDYYKKSLNISPDDTQTLYNLGLAYYSTEEYQLAYKYLQDAYNNKMDSCLGAYALSAYKAGKFKQAIELYTKLTELYPNKESYQYNLACCYDSSNDILNASKIIEKLLTFNMESLQLKLHLASLYTRLGKIEAAKILYADAIAMGFNDTNIMYEYAVLCAQTKDTDKAEEIFNEIIKIDPKYALAYKDLAIIYTSRRIFDRAEDYFKKAQKADPDNIYVLFELANYYQVMADFDKAKKLYDKLLKYSDVPSFMNLAIAKNYIFMNAPQKAKKILFDLFEKDPSNVDVLFYLAQVLMGEKDYNNAQQLLETAYTIVPNAEIANLLAKTYTELGLYDKAYQLYKVISVASPSSITLMLEMADCKYRQKDYPKALEHLKPILDMLPEHEEALELLEKIKNA